VGQLRTRLGIGARHITVSTVGIAPLIRRFADEAGEVRLAVSLHATTDASRSAMMPVNTKHNLQELMAACAYYNERTGRRLTFEWALIEGKNDSEAQAAELGALLRGLKCHVNLIPLNPTDGYDGKAPKAKSRNAERFVDELARAGVPATLRVRRGIDIDAGCGQLANKAKAEAAALAAEAEEL
jgi:23S rRNA (adenine2503-C2)-methyltransferase